MRKGTLITLIVLFGLLLVVAVIQFSIAAEDRPDCPGPVASPNATPIPGTSLECGP